MVQALAHGGIFPDLVLGTSIGALNGALFAADPTVAGADRLRTIWEEIKDTDVLVAPFVQSVRNVVSNRVALYETDALRRIVIRYLPTDSFADLKLRFECVAATIETGAEHWFDGGSLTEAILASAAVPGLFPPYPLGGFHYYDGGLVNSVPIDRAVDLGAATVYALQVGRLEHLLEPPQRMHEAALVAFEIARRNRFAAAMAALPADVTVHVLPSGNPLRTDDRRQLKWWDLGETADLVDTAFQATSRYLAEQVSG
jgi:NTE family protein